MKEHIRQVRLYFCEILLGWACRLAPKNTNERKEIDTFIRDYSINRIKEFEQEYKTQLK